MTELVGRVDHKIDSKFRLRIPIDYRKEMEGRLYFVVRPDHCIGVFPEKKKNELVEQLTVVKTNDPNYKFCKFLLNTIIEVHEDDQKRILIPNFYREYANLTSDCEVTSLGCVSHIEICLKKPMEDMLSEVDVEAGFNGMPL